MKKSRTVLIGVLTLLILAACGKDSIVADLNIEQSDLNNEQSIDLNSKKVYESKLQNRVLNSEALKGNFAGNSFTRKLQIYTPPGYKKNGSQQYPVVYLLHGFPLSEKAFIDRDIWDEWIDPTTIWTEYPDYPEEGFKLWIDNLIAEGTIEPMIIVMPDASTEPYGFSFYTNSILNGDFEDFIVKDLVGYMDDNYNTIAETSGRAVIGHSQGGYAAIKFGMLYPDIFGTVASHSGLLLQDALFSPGFIYLLEQENPGGFTGPDPAKFLTSALYAMSAAWSPNLNNPPFYVDLPLQFDQEGHLHPVPEVVGRWHQNDVFTLLGSYQDALNSLDGIYLDVGLYDELGTHLAHGPVIAKLNNIGIDYTYETYEGGHHTNMFERLAVALKFYSTHMN